MITKRTVLTTPPDVLGFGGVGRVPTPVQAWEGVLLQHHSADRVEGFNWRGFLA
jgi:hypothetical protein